MKYLLFVITCILLSCQTQQKTVENYKSETLQIQRLSDHTFVHISEIDIPNYGKFECNGLIFYDGNEAIVFDTPAEDEVSLELINWIKSNLQCEVKAVVINHFHEDCLGGLKAFHNEKIKSYANTTTIQLAKSDSVEIPQNGFDNELKLTVGKESVVNKFFGEAHSKDNIVSFIPGDQVLFGGCMIKALDAGKGNLNDANVSEWSTTVRKIKAEYPNLKIVVPGHGKCGGTDLLDYTIKMFEGL